MRKSSKNTKVDIIGDHKHMMADKWRVLLVENEPIQRMLIGRMLVRAGYEVIIAEDGQQAIKAVEEEEFSLLISNWDMPNLDGIGLCRALRSMNLSRYIYTILLTSRDASEHVVMGLQAGADDYLTKPIIEPELLARLNTGRRFLELERSLRKAVDENQRMAYSHPLTEVPNYRYLMSRLPVDLHQATILRRPLSLIICDIDNFKAVNDTHGHPFGGDVLVAVAAFLNEKANASGGWLSHHGGDEFAIVLPNIGPNQAMTIAESIRAMLNDIVIQLMDTKVQVTASFGVSGWEAAVPLSSTVDKLITAADAAVYGCKSNGRNKVAFQSML